MGSSTKDAWRRIFVRGTFFLDKFEARISNSFITIPDLTWRPLKEVWSVQKRAKEYLFTWQQDTLANWYLKKVFRSPFRRVWDEIQKLASKEESRDNIRNVRYWYKDLQTELTELLGSSSCAFCAWNELFKGVGLIVVRTTRSKNE